MDDQPQPVSTFVDRVSSDLSAQGPYEVQPTPRDNRITRAPISRRAMFFSGSGASIATALPSMLRVKQVMFKRNVLIRRIDMAATLVTELGAMAVALLEDRGLPIRIGLDDHTSLLAYQQTNPPVNVVLSQPISRLMTYEMFYEGIYLPSGGALSIYAAASNSANNLVTAYFNIFFEEQ